VAEALVILIFQVEAALVVDLPHEPDLCSSSMPAWRPTR
jgi:hypothetical protein